MNLDETSAITEFLLARIAEDEAAAQGAGLIAWLIYRRPDGSMDYTEVATATVYCPDIWVTAEGEAEGFASVMVIYDERRVLAECNAKERIVERYAFLAKHGDSGDARWVLPLLALPYADHPDCLPEWKP